MTLPLFVVDPALLAGAGEGTAVVLDGPEGRHAATVRRIAAGEQVMLADGAGLRATCEVVAAGRAQLDLRVVAVTRDAEPQPRLVLVQALAKGDRDDQAIESATELGVDEVVPWQAARSIVQWRGERGDKARRKWESTVLAATKQSRRARTPVVGELATTRALATRIAGAAAAYVLHEDATTPARDPGTSGGGRRPRRRRPRGRDHARGGRRVRGRGRRHRAARATACCARPAPDRPRSRC